MKRLYVIALSVLLALLWLTPAVLGADPRPATTGRVIISTSGDVSVPAGDQADVVIATKGTATIGGQVDTLVIVDGRAILTGAQVHTIFAARSSVDLGTGTVVTGDVLKVDSTVSQTADVVVQGSVRDVAFDLATIGLILAPAIILLVIGVALAMIAAGLLLAALGARQVRAAEGLISQTPGQVLVWGIGGIFVPLLIVILLFVSVIGAPIGLAILFGLWPVTAFVGYLVAAIWIGDWILHRTSPEVVRERPYLASVIGLVLLQLLTIVPFVGTIAGLFGYGAVLLLAWRTFRQGRAQSTTVAHPATPAPMAS